jgi:two-component system phosphate regulon response regulator PhoB
MKLQYDFPDLLALHALLDSISDTRELPLPQQTAPLEQAALPCEGDWVLARFCAGSWCCGVAARAFGRGESAHLTFEDRDWERLLACLRSPQLRGTLPGPNPRVLIVDHEEDTCHIVDAMLSKAGYETGTVETPEAALALLQREDWQLVIADFELLGMSSPIFCRRIRSDRRCATLPILLMSAKDEVDVARQARSVQADDFIIKPFRAPELVARSASLLQLPRTAAP